MSKVIAESCKIMRFCSLPRLRAAVLGCCLSLSCACTMVPVKNEEMLLVRDTRQDFSLEGRFSLRHAQDNYSGRISWQHQGATNDLILSSPFGQGIAEISTNATGARLLTSEGQLFESSSVEKLTGEVLGYPLPLDRLTRWVRGEDGDYHAIERDSLGRVLRFRHEGWNVDYGYDDDHRQLPPNHIFIERTGEFELRLKIDTWHWLDPDNAQRMP